MFTSTIQVTWQDGSKLKLRGMEGWNWLRDSLGVHLLREASLTGECWMVRATSGVCDVPNPGGTRFREIMVDFGRTICTPTRPRIAVRNGTQLVIGNTPGGDCIPPQGRISVRVAIGADPSIIFRRRAIRDGIRVSGRQRLPQPKSIKVSAGFVDEFRSVCAAGSANYNHGFDGVAFGPYHPWGTWQSDLPSGRQLSFMPGWEGSAELAMTRHDRGFDRANLDCLRKSDGEPHLTPPLPAHGYNFDRGWDGPGNRLPSFSVAGPGGTILPRWSNAGSCSYEAVACGIASYGVHPRCPNLEHLRRLTAEGEAAAEQYGDVTAALELRIVAADVSYGIRLVDIQADITHVALVQGKGHDWLGKRSCGWAIDALGAHPELRINQQLLAGACIDARQENGCINKTSYPYPYSPFAWTASPPQAGDINLPTGLKVTQAMEETICNYALARAGFGRQCIVWPRRLFVSEPDHPSILQQFGIIVKFLGVELNGQPLPRCTMGGGGTGYFTWVDLALGLILDDKAPYVAALMHVETPSKGLGTSQADTLNRLRSDPYKEQCALTIAALEAAG